MATELFTGGGRHGLKRQPGRGFAIRERHQLAVVEGACNECSNCEVYCPEEGAPFKLKEQVFLTHEAFAASPSLDGFCRTDNVLYARLGGVELRLEPEPERNRATVSGEGFRLDLTWEPFEVRRGDVSGPEMDLDSARLWRMRTVWESIFNSPVPNLVRPEPTTTRVETAGGRH